jgi:hypothetical protein
MIWVAVLVATAQGQAEEELARLRSAFARDVQPILTRHCVDCHNEFEASGTVNFEALGKPEAVLAGNRIWERVAQTQEARRMPPADSPQPSDEERQAILAWVRDYQRTLDTLEPFEPGPPLLRRLTRAEYANTIRDLLGISFDAADHVGLPEDQKVGAFSNNANALDVSDTLLEKYLAAAEDALSRSIHVTYPTQVFQADALEVVAHGTMPDPDSRKPPRFPDPPPAVEERDGAQILRVEADVLVPLTLAKPGLYRVAIRASGHGGDDGFPTLTIKLGGRLSKSIALPSDAAEPREYERMVSLPAGSVELSVGMLEARHNPSHREEAKRYRWLAIDSITVEGPLPEGRPVAVDPAVHKQIVFATPSASLTAENAARQVLGTFARRAFRRPVTEAEMNRLMGLFSLAQSQGESYESAVRWTLSAVLVSPQFLYRVETPRGTDGVHRVNDHELASRLSYFLWSTMPDERLMELADAGKLSEPATLAAEIQRMLADDRSDALIDGFFVPWLHLDRLQTVLPTEEQFPEFTQDVRNSFYQETILNLQYMRDENRPVLDLIDSDYTFVNRSLSLFYRFGGVYDSKAGFQRVPIKDPRRGGLLGQGSVLTLTSHVARTSPTMRGKWILEVMMGQPPPPPPPEAGELAETSEEIDLSKLTFRERLDLHARAQSCAGCHYKMDPLGFALDQYDPVGRWRNDFNGQPIDSTGVLPDGSTAKGPVEVKKYLLANKELFVRNLVEQMMTYALGRQLEYSDRPSVARIMADLEKNDYKFGTLIEGVATSYPFVNRRDE